MKSLFFTLCLLVALPSLAQRKQKLIKMQEAEIAMLKKQADSLLLSNQKLQSELVLLKKQFALREDSIAKLKRKSQMQEQVIARNKEILNPKNPDSVSPFGTGLNNNNSAELAPYYFESANNSENLVKKPDLSQIKVMQQASLHLKVIIAADGKILRAEHDPQKSSLKDMRQIQQIIQTLIKEGLYPVSKGKVSREAFLDIHFNRL